MGSRTFTAESIQAAISMVKESIGSDAVILNTRRLPKKTKDPYGKDLFEVTAINSSGISTNQIAPKSGATPLKQFQEPAATESQIPSVSIQAELDAIRDMIRMLSVPDGLPEAIRHMPECMNLYNRLAGSGMTERRARYFMRMAHESFNDSEITSSGINRKVIDTLVTTLEVSDPFIEISPAQKKAVALVGPTGAGKTTTVAKLAAELSITRKLKVGIISVDGYRIGALEQIKTYASIMGLQCMAAFSKNDLVNAMDKMQSRDVILVDTAGYSHFDSGRMKELSDLIMNEADMASLLVLSATTSREDMLEAAKRYSLFKPSAYVFTKLDETCRPGVILDQIMDMRLPVAFLTNGQRVPDDLVAATRKKIMSFVFEERRVAA